MAFTTDIIYKTATGEITSSRYRDDGDPALSPEAGQSYLDLGSAVVPLPEPTTHKIDLAGPTLVAKTQQEMDDEKNAILKESYRRSIATLESCKDKYLAEAPPWDTAQLDAEIADLRVLHDAMP